MNEPSTHAGVTSDGQPVSYRPRREFVDLFVGGWRVGSYKTQSGLDKAVYRFVHLRKEDR